MFKAPIIVYNYPKEIKAFYMRLNDDGKTVAAMDVLVLARHPAVQRTRVVASLRSIEQNVIIKFRLILDQTWACFF